MKNLFALLLWLVGGVATAQSVNGVSPSVSSVDGYNATAAKVLTYPQVQPTQIYNLSPTPTAIVSVQTSNWYQMNGNGAAIVEFQSNTFSGNYQVQVSDNPTPVSTPGTGYDTVVQDTATFASGGQGAQTKNWKYYIREGYKWIRLVVAPDVNNAPSGGTLNVTLRMFGNPVAGDAARSYTSGVPWKSQDQLFGGPLTAATPVPYVQSGAGTIYQDYKLPQGAHGFNLYTDIVGVSGASTITTTVYAKDPTTGQLQSLGVGGNVTHAAAVNTILVNPGYSSPYPVATPPAGLTILSNPMAQDIVIGNTFTGTGSTTFYQSAVPVQ